MKIYSCTCIRFASLMNLYCQHLRKYLNVSNFAQSQILSMYFKFTAIVKSKASYGKIV